MHAFADDLNHIFYIGKGVHKRKFSISDRNIKWKELYGIHGRKIYIIANNLTEESALNLEWFLINEWKSVGMCEANLNIDHGDVTRAKPNSHMKTPEYKKMFSDMLTGRKTPWMEGDLNHMRDPEWMAANIDRIREDCKNPIRRAKISKNKLEFYSKPENKESLYGALNPKATMFEAYSLVPGDTWACSFFCKEYGGQFIGKDAGNILAQSKGLQKSCGTHPETGAKLGWRKIGMVKDIRKLSHLSE